MPPRRSQQLAAWLALAFALGAHDARAAPSLQLGLEYEADPAWGCPSATELSASIAGQLGYEPFSSAGAEQRLRIHIKRAGSRLEAQVEWIDRDQNSEGERRLASEDGDCSALARSLAFAVAVQIQLHASAEERPPTATTAPLAPPVARPSSVVAPLPEAAAVPQPAAQRRLLLGVGAMARHGLTPGVAPGVRLFGAISNSWGALELSAHATVPTELQLRDGTGFSAHELGANLVPCVRLSRWGLCAVGTLSLLRVRGQGVDRIGTPAALLGGVGGRVQLSWPELERFGVLVQGEALAVLSPQDVMLNQSKVWATAPLAFTAILDLTAIFR